MHETVERLWAVQFDRYSEFPRNATPFLLRVYHRIGDATIHVSKAKERKIKPFTSKSKPRHTPYSYKKSTWRRAGTGLAAVQTSCHVLPGISMRELSRPLRAWCVPSLKLLESVRIKKCAMGVSFRGIGVCVCSNARTIVRFCIFNPVTWTVPAYKICEFSIRISRFKTFHIG